MVVESSSSIVFDRAPWKNERKPPRKLQPTRFAGSCSFPLLASRRRRIVVSPRSFLVWDLPTTNPKTHCVLASRTPTHPPFFTYPLLSTKKPKKMSEKNDLTPITVVTGFLGAGKTTLVNYILKEQKDWKICVLENEFGEVSIDDGLVAESLDAPEDLITMDNGCVCCSVRGDLVRTLGQLVKRRKDFDAILLETTGLADPAPIVYTIQTNSKMSENYFIDSIVCLADAKYIQQHLDEKKPDGAVNEAYQQVAFADKILLNKIDLVTEKEKIALKERLANINKFAVTIETERSRAPLEKILGLNSFNMESILSVDPDFFESMEGDSKHNLEIVQSVGVMFKGELHAQWFNLFMMDLLRERAADIYRSKGLLAFHGQGNTKFVFQGVHEQINFGPAKQPWKEGEEKVNKFVFIGKGLNREELTKSLMECLYKEDTKA